LECPQEPSGLGNIQMMILLAKSKTSTIQGDMRLTTAMRTMNYAIMPDQAIAAYACDRLVCPSCGF
jgi:hypothetical protein